MTEQRREWPRLEARRSIPGGVLSRWEVVEVGERAGITIARLPLSPSAERLARLFAAAPTLEAAARVALDALEPFAEAWNEDEAERAGELAYRTCHASAAAGVLRAALAAVAEVSCPRCEVTGCSEGLVPGAKRCWAHAAFSWACFVAGCRRRKHDVSILCPEHKIDWLAYPGGGDEAALRAWLLSLPPPQPPARLPVPTAITTHGLPANLPPVAPPRPRCVAGDCTKPRRARGALCADHAREANAVQPMGERPPLSVRPTYCEGCARRWDGREAWGWCPVCRSIICPDHARVGEEHEHEAGDDARFL
jgi:hypothetical protein